MKILNILRNKVFWLLDNFRGKPVRSAYDEIKKIDEMDCNDPYIVAYHKKSWESLKKKACSTTSAYQQYSNVEFVDFPMITKQKIRQCQNEFLSSDYTDGDLIKMFTSGSTGTPFVCYQNKLKKARVNAEIIYYSEKVGYKLGDNLSYIRTIVKQNKKSSIKQFIQNQTLLNCKHLDDEGIEILFHELAKQSKKESITLLAYGSTYTAIMNYLKNHELKEIHGINIRGAISGSDMLFDETRNYISNAFGRIPFVSRYSNEENGVIGQDEGLNNIFVINEANYIVEVLSEDGEILEDGKIGRIVVTDLYNYAMPMIRYDTGDVGAIEIKMINGRNKKCITNFSGRRVDVIYDENNKPISPHSITNIMWKFTDINQFQIIQTDVASYTMKINPAPYFNRKEEVLESLKTVLGSNTNIVLEEVEEVPVLSSGKRRYIVNQMK